MVHYLFLTRDGNSRAAVRLADRSPVSTSISELERALFERVQLVGDDVPNDLEVDAEILMDEHIA